MFKQCLKLTGRTLLVIVAATITLNLGCSKKDTNISQNEEALAVKFFSTEFVDDKDIILVANEIEKKNHEEHFLSGFIEKNGYIQWHKSEKVNSQDEFLAILPFAFEGGRETNGFVIAKRATPNEKMTFDVFYKENMIMYGFEKKGSKLIAPKVQSLINYFNFKNYNTNTFKVKDIRQVPEEVKKSFAFKLEKNKVFAKFKIKPNNLNSSQSIATNSFGNGSFCFSYWEETEWWWNPDGDAGNNNGDEYYMYSTYDFVSVCIYDSASDGYGGDGFGGGGGGGGNGGNPPVNQNGFLYSRLNELNTILASDPYALTPCDSLNLMPLDPDNGFGLMYQRIAQHKLPNYVKDRIDSIKNVAPNWIVDNFALQSIDDATGPIVNCDFFPVRIKQLPAGMTAKSLTEYFRKNINSFIDPTIGVSFFPYSSGNFNDITKFNSAYESSLGALVHIKMLNDGSVILSDYNNNNTSGSEKHRFKFSTIETPLDYEHPVAGNREFGIYEDPTRPGEFTFYTMGVDRTWDITFASGNWTGAGFRSADKLWSNVQDKMIMFIKANGGQAEFYSQKSIIARPKWDDVKDYLYGNIDFATLKQRLGC